jgi:hypothetical protein
MVVMGVGNTSPEQLPAGYGDGVGLAGLSEGVELPIYSGDSD